MDEEMRRMQEEAAERVRSMQRRARLYVRPEEEQHPHRDEGKHLPVAPPEKPAAPCAAGPREEKLAKTGGSSFLSALTGDKERLLLLMLAVLLVNNDADMELVVALLYLAM